MEVPGQGGGVGEVAHALDKQAGSQQQADDSTAASTEPPPSVMVGCSRSRSTVVSACG